MQAAAVLQAAAGSLALDSQPAVAALKGWLEWLATKGLLVATREHKERALKTIFDHIEDRTRVWNWRQEAADIAVNHQDSCSQAVMSALLAVKDRATFRHAVGTFVLTATCLKKIQAVVDTIAGGANAGAECLHWVACLLESVLQVRTAR